MPLLEIDHIVERKRQEQLRRDEKILAAAKRRVAKEQEAFRNGKRRPTIWGHFIIEGPWHFTTRKLAPNMARRLPGAGYGRGV